MCTSFGTRLDDIIGPFSGFIKFSMKTSNRLPIPGAGAFSGLRWLTEGFKRMGNWTTARKLRQTMKNPAQKRDKHAANTILYLETLYIEILTVQ